MTRMICEICKKAIPQNHRYDFRQDHTGTKYAHTKCSAREERKERKEALKRKQNLI